MRDIVRVAAIQMGVEALAPQHNREHMLCLLEQAFGEGHPDLVVFPELANTGYVIGRDREFGRRFFEAAESITGPTVALLQKACRQFRVHAVVGLALVHPTIAGGLLNAAVLVDANGEVRGVVGKVHLSGEERHYFFAGDSISPIPTDLGTLGLQVCFDARFPEVSRILSLMGAEILCVPFAGPSSQHSPLQRLEFLASTRASENLNFFVACNRVGREGTLEFYGRSAIAGPTGEVLARSLSSGEEILQATLTQRDLVEERIFKAVYPDRRPELYSELTRPLSAAFKKQDRLIWKEERENEGE